MSEFTLHDQDSAPKGSFDLLGNSLNAFGMIPNLHAVMAESPELLEAYQRIHALFVNTSLSEDEKTVVWQTINVEHGCHYCVPAHAAIAKSMKVDDAITDALRNKTPLPNERLEALRTFTLAVVQNRGQLSDGVVKAFLDAGFTNKNILEVMLGVSQKVMSNYTNHLADTPVDDMFKPFS